MKVYSIGFTRRTAAEFFTVLRWTEIRRLLDVHLHNASQLSGFTKRDDLPFFLKEWARNRLSVAYMPICQITHPWLVYWPAR